MCWLYQVYAWILYLLADNIVYAPRNLERTKINCYAKYKELEKIINIFGCNYADFFKFKNEIYLYLDHTIDFNEMENLIINRYRQEYSSKF